MYAVSNVIGSLVFGNRLDYGSERLKKYMEIIIESFEVMGISGVLTVFPFVRYCPGDPFKCRKIHQQTKFMKNEFREMMQEHRAELNSTGEPKDLIDAYLREIEKNKDMDTYFCEDQLVQVIGDLYGAGTESSSTTLRWALIFMLHNQEVLFKVQAEIDDILGGRLPTMMDKQKMPYVEATLSEIQRMGDMVPFSVPHCTTEDVSFRDFFIPQGTMILPNLYSVHHNEAHFKDAFKFDPSRFLDDEGCYRPIKQLIPFGIGRRVCLGESLARMELFLFFTSLLQRFSPSLPSGEELPSLTGTLHITNEPPPLKVIFSARS
ncbi:hypothetical protein CAPTEDRAFT_142591 [Capitella teleta]|uniref:Uncharacterized protein n=1 Tax=Capitella teleta TaxID=283909 RepID=R7VB92_CAPTE|nr:hypothetical protein CAPTEDRAFT_142591 [Capitella teleta]|eukprot:ELU15807.1 hypothetical protein CAPTEDRAFT_142591 [Capitella teleta]